MLPPLPSYPPTANTSPLLSKTAEWSVRTVFEFPVRLKVALVGAPSIDVHRYGQYVHQ